MLDKVTNIPYKGIMERKLQRLIARKVRVSDGYISMIINGKRRPSWKIAKILSQVTNTRPDLWLDGDSNTIKAVLGSIKVK